MRTRKRSGSSNCSISRRGLLTAATLAPLWAAPPVRLVDHEGEKVSFLAGERLLFEYRYSASRPKTYVHPFCAPDGSAISVDSPPDHVHHRGLMLAWSVVNGFDFWGEVNPAPHGQIIHQRFEPFHRTMPVGLTSIEHWIADGKLLLVERRTIRVPKVAPDAVWLDWTTELTPAADPVMVAAGKHVYDGLGIRFVSTMDGGGVLNAEGTTTIKAANGERAAWCAYHGMLNQRDAGVAIFDHPGNPRHPTPFFVMNHPFGYLSAAPTFRKPFPLKRGQRLRLRYAVVSSFGKPEAERLEKMYREWSGSR